MRSPVVPVRVRPRILCPSIWDQPPVVRPAVRFNSVDGLVVNGTGSDKDQPYYVGKGNLRLFDIIDAFDLDFYEGTVLKYLLRWRRKGGVEDLRKAHHALGELIRREEH